MPILTITATIIDIPATMLNVTGDSVSSMMVARVVEGKGWIDNKASELKTIDNPVKEVAEEKPKNKKKKKH